MHLKSLGNTMALNWSRSLMKYPLRILIALVIVTVFLGWLAGSQLRIENSIESWAPKGATSVTALSHFRETFGRPDSYIVVAEGDVFSKDFMVRLKALHEELASIKGRRIPSQSSAADKSSDPAEGLAEAKTHADSFEFADSADVDGDDDFFDAALEEPLIDTVTSLWDVKRPLRQGDSVTIDRIISRLDDGYDSEDFRKRVLSDSFLQSRLVGAQGRMTLMNVVPVEMSDDEVIALYDRVRAVVETHQKDEFRLSLTGALALSAQVNELVASDFSTLGGLSFAFVLLVLFLLFRSWVGIFGPMMVVLASLIWTLGLMALLGYPLTILSTILPAFLFCVGVADSIHFLSVWRTAIEDQSCEAAVEEALKTTGRPILFTSLTTACGLISLSLADVTVIGELGMSGGLGVLCAWFLSMTLLPAIVLVFGNSQQGTDISGLPWVRTLLSTFGRLSGYKENSARGRVVLWCGFALFLASLAGMTLLDVRHDDLEFLPKGSSIRQSMRQVDEALGGSAVAELVLQGEADRMRKPDVLVAIEKLAEITTNPSDVNLEQAKSSASVTEVLRTLHQLFSGDKEAQMPEEQASLSQLQVLFENQGPDAVKRWVTTDWSETRLSFRINWREATAYGPFIEKLEVAAQKMLPKDIEFVLTGFAVIAFQLVNTLLRDLIVSFCAAFAFVTILMLVMLKDVRLGLVAMLPNLLPIFLVLGGMGVTDIPIDLNSLLVSSMALGIAVDDTMHFLFHFQKHYKKTNDVEESIGVAIATAGQAMVMTSVILVVGFMVFCFSSSAASLRFGLLTAVTVLFAVLIDLIILPALLRALYRDQPLPISKN